MLDSRLRQCSVQLVLVNCAVQRATEEKTGFGIECGFQIQHSLNNEPRSDHELMCTGIYLSHDPTAVYGVRALFTCKDVLKNM